MDITTYALLLNKIKTIENKLSEKIGTFTPMPLVTMNETTANLQPNVVYQFGVVEKLNITLIEGETNTYNQYIFSFISGENPTILTLPNTVLWNNELEIKKNYYYEISITNNIAVWLGFDATRLTFAKHADYPIAVTYAEEFETIETALNSFANVATYSVNSDKSEVTTSIIAVPLSSDVSADVKAEYSAMVMDFRKKYASPDTTEPYLSSTAMQSAYAEITAYIAENSIAIKTMADDSFFIGAQALIDNFIAGTYENGVYSSALLNEEQAAEIGVLLEGIYMLKNAEYTPKAVTIGLLNTATQALFDYVTQTRATNLQFAAEMRAEMEGFADSQYSANGAEYYYGTDSETNKYIEISGYIFSEDARKTLKSTIAKHFDAEDKWPLIYQVNGIEWTEAELEGKEIIGAAAVVNFDKEVAGSDGSYARSAGTTATAADEDIIAILNLVGSKSQSYKALMTNRNSAGSLNMDSMDWIFESAFTADKKYVVAEPAQTNGKPAAYSPAWYTEGYGVASDGTALKAGYTPYYVYMQAEGDSHFNAYSQNGGWFEKGIDDTYFWTEYGDRFQKFDETLYQETEDIYESYISPTNYTEFKQMNFGAISNTLDFVDIQIGMFEDDSYYLKFGYTHQAQEELVYYISQVQSNLESAAQAYYRKIASVNEGLKLLPATDAYRNVVKLYWQAQGWTATWSTNANNAKKISPDSTDASTPAKFFYSNSKFLEDLNTLLVNKVTATADSGSGSYGSGYSTGTVSEIDLWEEAYTADSKTAIKNFYKAEIEYVSSHSTFVTIEQAALVDGGTSTEHPNGTYSYSQDNKTSNNLLTELIEILANSSVNGLEANA